MSLYNMVQGMTPAVFFVLPMLGKHPDEFPRFRDCFLSDPEHPEYDDHIIVFTRTGGGNREEYELENDGIRNISGFVFDYDDSYDTTYACWVFKVPDEWRADFGAYKRSGPSGLSEAYRDRVKEIYPKLADKLDDIFNQRRP